MCWLSATSSSSSDRVIHWWARSLMTCFVSTLSLSWRSARSRNTLRTSRASVIQRHIRASFQLHPSSLAMIAIVRTDLSLRLICFFFPTRMSTLSTRVLLHVLSDVYSCKFSVNNRPLSLNMALIVTANQSLYICLLLLLFDALCFFSLSCSIFSYPI